MEISKFYAIPKNMGLGYVSSYLSYALGDHGISVEPIHEKAAGIVLDGRRIGTLEYDNKLGIRTRSSDELFEYLFGEPFENEYKATDGFRWLIQHKSGNDNKKMSEKLTEFSKYDKGVIVPISLLTHRADKMADPLSHLPYRDKDGLPVMFTQESGQYQ